MSMDTHSKKFLDKIELLSKNHDTIDICRDFVLFAATSISNQSDLHWGHYSKDVWRKREDLFLEHKKKYAEDEFAAFPEMFAIMTIALDENSKQDFLGDIYNHLGLTNHRNGQHLTPFCLSMLIAQLQGQDLIAKAQTLDTVRVSDECCGSGSMLIAMANFAKDNGINYQRKLIFLGQDIDWFMGLSCYIQLSLLGCSGFIRIADTLKDPIGNADFMSENVWVFPLSKIQLPRKEGCLVSQEELENDRKEIA